MKWSSKQALEALKGDLKTFPPLILFYGEDGGMARSIARKFGEKVSPDINDPFMVDRIGIEEIHEDPARVLDAAGTVGFGDGLRLIRVEGVNSDIPKQQKDSFTAAVKMALEGLSDASVIVISAPGFDNKLAVTKAVESHKKAVAVNCYHDNDRDISCMVSAYFLGKGVRVLPDALTFLKDNLGNDHDITLMELEKLYLYTKGKSEISVEDCFASITNSPSLNVFKLCDSIGMRDTKKVDYCIKVLQEEGEDLTGISIMVTRHIRRLLIAREYVDQGMQPETAITKLKPPVFYGKAEFIAQLRKYPPARLRKTLDTFYDMQLESRSGHIPPHLVIERALLRLAV